MDMSSKTLLHQKFEMLAFGSGRPEKPRLSEGLGTARIMQHETGHRAGKKLGANTHVRAISSEQRLIAEGLGASR